MRYRGIVICCILIGCKAATTPTSTSSYSEDLSIHRPSLLKEDIKTNVSKKETFVPMNGHIKAELDSVINISIAQNKKGRLVEGYILQIYTGNNRNAANEAWYKMDTDFPELSPKISYRAPNFQVRAGRFTDKLAAHRALEEVKKDFPKALLVPDRFTMTYE